MLEKNSTKKGLSFEHISAQDEELVSSEEEVEEVPPPPAKSKQPIIYYKLHVHVVLLFLENHVHIFIFSRAEGWA